MLERYTAVADDGESAAQRREAAALLSLAGGQLDEEGDVDEALRAGNEAVDLFRKLGDSKAVADALRVTVDALRLKAVRLREEPLEAEKAATEALASFKADGDKRGQASMLLALARVSLARQGSKHRDAALRQAKQAAALAQQAQDSLLGAASMLALAEAQVLRRRPLEALKEGQRALQAFRDVNDKRGQAMVLRSLAAALRLDSQPELALRALGEALALARELRDRRGEAVDLQATAEVRLEQDSAREALAAAREALALAQGLQPGGPLHLAALAVTIRAHQADRDALGAIDAARAAAEALRAAGAFAAEAEALELLSQAHLAADHGDEALACADEAVEKARKAQNKWREAAALCNKARVQFQRKDYLQTLVTVREAQHLYEELGDSLGAAQAQHLAVEAHARKGSWSEAMRAAGAARELFAKAKEKHHEARALLVISVLHWVQQEELDAMSSAREAQFLFQRENDHIWEATALHHIAEMYAWTWNCSPALKAVSRACDLIQDAADKKSVASALSTKGVIKLMILVLQTHKDSKPDESSDQLETSEAVMADIIKAKVVSEKCGDKKLAMFNLFHIAEVHLVDGRTREAMASIRQGEEMNAKEEDKHAEVVALILQGYVHLAEGDTATAHALADKAMAVARTNADAQAEEHGAWLAKDLKETIDRQLRGMAPATTTATVTEAAVAPKPPEVDLALVRNQILDVASSMLGSETLATDTPLMDAGLDSLSMVEFRNELVKEFPGVDLPGALLFDYPTVTSLVDFIGEGIRAAGLAAYMSVPQEIPVSIQEAAKGPKVDPVLVKLKIASVATSLLGTESLSSDTPLMDAGLDSLSMVEFRNELVKEFQGVNLPGALLFDHPTIAALVDFVTEQLTSEGMSFS